MPDFHQNLRNRAHSRITKTKLSKPSGKPAVTAGKYSVLGVNFYHGEDDAGHDHEADLDVGEHGERDDEDADHGETDVAVELGADDLVRLPLLVDERVGERVRGEVDALHHLPDALPRRDVLAGTVEVQVVDRPQDHGLQKEEGVISQDTRVEQ